MQQIKGAVLKSRMAFIQEHFGVDGVHRVLASLPDGDQRTLRMLFTSNWYPFDLGKSLDDAIVRVLGGGKPEFFERLGAASAEKNLSTIHTGYLTRGDPHGFLSKSPSFYSLYYETGRRGYTQAGREGRGTDHLRRRHLQRARLPDRHRVVPEGAGDVRRDRGDYQRGGVPRARRSGVPVPGDLGLGTGAGVIHARRCDCLLARHGLGIQTAPDTICRPPRYGPDGPNPPRHAEFEEAMPALRAPHLWILCSTLGIVLTGCRDDSQSPPSRPEPPLDQDAPAGSMLAPIDLVYICGNKFLATNATPTSVHVVYRVAGTEESGGLTLRPGLIEEDQGHSETELQTVEKGTVELYLDDERVVRRRNEGSRCGTPGHLGRHGHGRRRGDGRIMDRPVRLADGRAPPEPDAERARIVLGSRRHPPSLEPRHRRFHQRSKPIAAVLLGRDVPARWAPAGCRRTHHQ